MSNRVINILVPVISIIIGLIVGAIVMVVSGYDQYKVISLFGQVFLEIHIQSGTQSVK